eukprot:s2232_g16.t1
MINGLDHVISSAHRTVALSLKEEWQNMVRANLLLTEWHVPSFIDVLMFACSLVKFRKENNKKPLKSAIINSLKVKKRRGSLATQDLACFDDETPVLTLVMDQGPPGMAAMAYLQSLGVLVHCSFDKESDIFQKYMPKIIADFDLPEDASLELAFKCLSNATYENAHVMYICSGPSQRGNSWHMKHVKTAMDNLRFQLHLSRSITWQCERHLRELAQFLSPVGWSSFDTLMNAVLNPDQVAKKIFPSVTQLLGRRCASLSRHSSPPYSYVGLLGDDFASSRAAGDPVISDLTSLLHLEVSTIDQGQNLAADLRLTLDAC